MRLNKIRFHILSAIMLSLAVAGACRSHVMAIPDGFVSYERDTSAIRALSADGVRLRTTELENKPLSDAKLWNEALELRLKKQGYRVLKKSDFVTESKLKGRLLESLYNYNGRDYTYLTAVFIQGDSIYLVEAAGPYKIFKEHRAGIMKSIKTFRLN